MVVVTFPILDWIEELKLSYSTSIKMEELLHKPQNNIEVPKGYSLQYGLIMKKWRIVVVPNSALKNKVLEYIHVNPHARQIESARFAKLTRVRQCNP